VHPSLIGNIGQLAGAGLTGREVIRQKPHSRSSGQSLETLADALTSHLTSMNKPDVGVIPNAQIPPDTIRGKLGAILDQDAYLRSSRKGDDYGVTYNPNADRALLAHELGHVASQQTDVGRVISNLRHTPAMKDALTKAALLTVPAGAVAALTQGDDDMAASVALTYAMSAPTILDEALATHHGLRIMDRAGLAPQLGGRAKLAGGLLSYLATPLAIGATANMAGNIMDDELVGQPNQSILK
jgi:hypothetical protein